MADNSDNRPARNSIACVGCRNIKTKCIVQPDDDQGRCTRCIRLDIECVWHQKKRGRKTAAERSGSSITNWEEPEPAVVAQAPSLLPFTSGQQGNNSSLDSYNGFTIDPTLTQANTGFQSMLAGMPQTSPGLGNHVHFGSGGTGDPSPQSLDQRDGQNGQVSSLRPRIDDMVTMGGALMGLSDPGATIGNGSNNAYNNIGMAGGQAERRGENPGSGGRRRNSAGPSSARRPVMDIAEMLDPHSSDEEERQRTPERARPSPRTRETPSSLMNGDDPVALNVVSQVESVHLVTKFFAHLNPLANLLDPKLHTFDYIRSTSTPLFTMLLAASAKFFKPSLYLPLLSHGQTLINRATISGNGCDLGVVQAIAIGIYWKEPQDTTVWTRIGMAIRLACQLGAHLDHVRPLPSDELEARRRLDLERTWMNLICFDQTYSDLFRLPRMIRRRDIPDPTKWITESDIHVPVNANVACSVDHITSVDLSEVTDPTLDLSSYAVQIMLERHTETIHRLQRKWFRNDGMQMYLHPSSVAVLQWLNVARLFRLKQLAVLHQTSSSTDGGIGDVLTTLVQVVEHVEIAAQNSRLVYAQDILACGLSEMAVFAHRIFHRLTTSQKALLVSLLKRVHNCCPTTSEGAATPATAFVARFFERTLRSISTESRMNTRPSTPIGGQAGTTSMPRSNDQADGVRAISQGGIRMPVGTAEGSVEEMQPMPAQTMQDLDQFLATFNLQNQNDNALDGQYWASLFSGIPDFQPFPNGT